MGLAHKNFRGQNIFFCGAEVMSKSAREPIETRKSSQNMMMHTVVRETNAIRLDHWKFVNHGEFQP